MEKTIEIPEGYEARIEGNKVILEPKESEDERIRTRLIALVEAFGQGTYKDEMLAYLERQKGIVMHTPRYAPPEQKPAEWSKEDKLHLNNAILIAKKEWGVNSYTARWLEALRDNYKKCNSHWKPSEEQMWALDVALENFYHQSDRSALESLKTDLQKL